MLVRTRVRLRRTKRYNIIAISATPITPPTTPPAILSATCPHRIASSVVPIPRSRRCLPALVSIITTLGSPKIYKRTATGRYAHCGTAVVLGIGFGYLMAILIKHMIRWIEQTHTPSWATILHEAFQTDHLEKLLSEDRPKRRGHVRRNGFRNVLAFRACAKQ
jgi:hypothetical protein